MNLIRGQNYVIWYLNHVGELSVRTVNFREVWYGVCPYHSPHPSFYFGMVEFPGGMKYFDPNNILRINQQ